MTSDPQRLISVTGSAEVRVAPDLVQVLLAVDTSDKTLAKAKAENDQRLTRTLAVLKRFASDPNDLQTDRISVEPLFDSGASYAARRASEPEGYKVRRTVVVTLRDLKRFEELISAVLDAGTNRIDGVEFQTTALRTHRDAARAMALKAAHEKARAMAAELNCTVGRPQHISEGSATSGLWRYPGGRASAMNQNVASAEAQASGDASEGFAPGLISVTASVSVTFTLVD